MAPNKPKGTEPITTQPLEMLDKIIPMPEITPIPSNVIVMGSMGPTPMKLVCPYCKALVSTITELEVGTFGYLIGYCLAINGCFCGCCLIPCCCERCQDTTHTCPSCKNYLGSFKRL